MLTRSKIVPKGPDFDKSRPVTKDLCGCTITFSAPAAQDPFLSSKKWESEPQKINIYDKSQYTPYWVRRKNGEKEEFSSIKTITAYSSIWEFRGLPILEGYCGDLIFTLDVFQLDSLPVNESLFDNRVLSREAYKIFDITKLQDFHSGYSDDETDITDYRWPSFIGPINSQWLKHSGQDWLYMEDQPLIGKTQEICWITAIDHKIFLNFSFSYNRSSKKTGDPFGIEKKISKESFLELASKIFSSVNISVTKELEEKKKEAQSKPEANKKFIHNVSQEQIKNAEYILHMWSTGDTNGKNGNSRAPVEEISAFLRNRIKHQELPNSYTPDEILEIETQSASREVYLSEALTSK